jgi:hypothetical protein
MSSSIAALALLLSIDAGAVTLGDDSNELASLVSRADLVAVVHVDGIRDFDDWSVHVIVDELLKGPLVGVRLTIQGERSRAAFIEGKQLLVFLTRDAAGSFTRVAGSRVHVLSPVNDVHYVGAEPRRLSREQLIDRLRRQTRHSGVDVVSDVQLGKRVSVDELGLGKDCGPMFSRAANDVPSACLLSALERCEEAFSIAMEAKDCGENPSQMLFAVVRRGERCVMTVVKRFDETHTVVKECARAKAPGPLSTARLEDSLEQCSVVHSIASTSVKFR